MRTYLLKLIKTDSENLIASILRLTLGFVIFPHGAQKLFGWFGGHGAQWTMEMWHQWWGIPFAITFLVILAESFGAVALMVGFFSRFMATSIGMVMLGAVYLVHWNNEFFMNWYAQPNRGEGFEFHLLALGIVIALLFTGSGKWSLDNLIQKKLKRPIGFKA